MSRLDALVFDQKKRDFFGQTKQFIYFGQIFGRGADGEDDARGEGAQGSGRGVLHHRRQRRGRRIDMGGVVERIAAGTLLCILVLFLVAGIVGRCLGWSDASAPTRVTQPTVDDSARRDSKLRMSVSDDDPLFDVERDGDLDKVAGISCSDWRRGLAASRLRPSAWRSPLGSRAAAHSSATPPPGV